jgi:hypothetical protein
MVGLRSDYQELIGGLLDCDEETVFQTKGKDGHHKIEGRLERPAVEPPCSITLPAPFCYYLVQRTAVEIASLFCGSRYFLALLSKD